jgi:hypothetical protein
MLCERSSQTGALMPCSQFDPGTATYDSSPKQRIPSWTDRVLFRSKIPNGVVCEQYDALQDMLASDHRPVVALLAVHLNPQTGPPRPRRFSVQGAAATAKAARAFRRLTDPLLGELRVPPTPADPSEMLPMDVASSDSEGGEDGDGDAKPANIDANSDSDDADAPAAAQRAEPPPPPPQLQHRRASLVPSITTMVKSDVVHTLQRPQATGGASKPPAPSSAVCNIL